MIVRILAGSIIALGLGFYSEHAHAEQTFVCEDGRMLQVSLDNLERLKREDGCVAAYYGLKVESVPLPVRRPAHVREPIFKGAQAAAQTVRNIGQVAQAPADFRNVRIINAAPGSSGWYSHTR